MPQHEADSSLLSEEERLFSAFRQKILDDPSTKAEHVHAIVEGESSEHRELKIPNLPGHGDVKIVTGPLLPGGEYQSTVGDHLCSVYVTRYPQPGLEEKEVFQLSPGRAAYSYGVRSTDSIRPFIPVIKLQGTPLPGEHEFDAAVINLSGQAAFEQIRDKTESLMTAIATRNT